MSEVFITDIHIESVRHLNNVHIEVCKEARRNLILTGPNGSGKTSVLEAIKRYLSMYVDENAPSNIRIASIIKEKEDRMKSSGGMTEEEKTEELIRNNDLRMWKNSYERFYDGLVFDVTSESELMARFIDGQCIVAYYPAERIYKKKSEKYIKDVELKTYYTISEKPGDEFVEYIKTLKSKEGMFARKGESDKADAIARWFDGFQGLLCRIFDDDALALDFDVDTLEFKILQSGREPFDFSQLSDGYAAILDIVVDLLMRAEKRGALDIQGIVLIDEIETHLHLELQKSIIPFLTALFPRIQFIVTTHSPFVITSDANAIVYDLERRQRISGETLSQFSYEGAVEGYFGVEAMSESIMRDFARYKELVAKQPLTPADIEEIAGLEDKLDETPDYLNRDFAAEYEHIKLEKGLGRVV